MDIYELIYKQDKQILNEKFFRMLTAIGRYKGEKIFLKYDKFCLGYCGTMYGKDWIKIKNINACAPFNGLVIGLKTKFEPKYYPSNIRVKKWWKEGEYILDEGDKDTYLPPHNSFDAVNIFTIPLHSNANDVIIKNGKNDTYKSIIKRNVLQWYIDCGEDWLDGRAVIGYLVRCMEAFYGDECKF
jgi:hypothetical protein